MPWSPAGAVSAGSTCRAACGRSAVLARCGSRAASQGGSPVDERDMGPELKEVLISADQLQARTRELAAQIDADYAGRELLLVRILKDLDTDITGRHVLIVEDIVDSGLTLSWLVGNLRSRGPASLAVCAMLRKPGLARQHVDVAYTGFDIGDEFVVGYGLDYAQRYRNLPFVGTLAPAVYTRS